MKTIEDIIKSSWSIHRDLLESPHKKTCLVKDSFPILWFGDMDAYRKSKRKVVTVGLNPSLHEFPAGKDRFPRAATLRGKKTLVPKDIEAYTSAMNAYFEEAPYNQWFDKIEKAINPLDASYYAHKKLPNRAVHIDIYSPSATNPTWSGLCEEQRKYIDERSNGLYEDMMAILKPDVVLISANSVVVKEHFPVDFIAYLGEATKGKNYLRAGKTKDECVVIWGFNNISGPFSINKETLEEKIRQIKNDYAL